MLAPASLPVRPTTDYAKSGLFNILNNKIDFESLRVLDLFSGVGGISLEFASRGAKNVTAVDIHFNCVKYLNDTAAKLGIKELKCIRSDVYKFLKQNTSTYDLIFADPPFDQTETDQIPDLIFERKLLEPGGILIIEHQSKRELNSKVPPTEIRKYGNVGFSFFEA